MLFGIAEVEFDLKAETVVINDLLRREVEVGAEKDHMSAFACFEVGFDDHDDIE